MSDTQPDAEPDAQPEHRESTPEELDIIARFCATVDNDTLLQQWAIASVPDSPARNAVPVLQAELESRGLPIPEP